MQQVSFLPFPFPLIPLLFIPFPLIPLFSLVLLRSLIPLFPHSLPLLLSVVIDMT